MDTDLIEPEFDSPEWHDKYDVVAECVIDLTKLGLSNG